jgi:hypothetical protein
MPHPAIRFRVSRCWLRVVAALLLGAVIVWAILGLPTMGRREAVWAAPLSISPAALPTVTPRPAATPTARVIELAPAPGSPVPTATPSPSPAAPPTSTPSPTPVPPPTVAPTATLAPNRMLTFAAEDWVGGYYRGDGRWYGRTWVAIYGQASPYPAAWLTLSLDATPTGPATLTITGLDDEWAAQNPIVVLVNGTVLYNGVSPWPNWDGVGHGENAVWTPATFAIPPGVLQAGANQIVVANRSPSANFGLPPYVLVSEATLGIAGG